MSWQQVVRATPPEVERVVDRVFARPEFNAGERTLFEDLLEWILETFDVEVNPGTVGGVLDGGMKLLLVVIVAALVWALVRFGLEYARSRSGLRSDALEQRLATRSRVRELYAGALEARRRGDYRLAVRLGLFALVTGLGVNGVLEYRDAWTYREILRNGAPAPATSELLHQLVDELEAKEFGDEPVSEADLDQLEALCTTHLAGVLEGSA